MSENTKIEWCDHTFNPWIGCTKVGPGCDNCYAKADFEDRKHRVVWGAGHPRSRTSIANWKQPVKWNRHAGVMQNAWAIGVEMHGGDEAACIAAGYIKPKRPKVFCASLADVFDNAVPVQWRMDLFTLIAATPNLDWLILTKRIGNVMPMCSGDSLMFDLICDRVWLGATIVNQEEADRDIPKLLAVPAAKRFLSMEPLLGPVDILKWLDPWTCADCSFHGSENDCGPDGCEKCGEQDAFGTEDVCKSCGADDQSAKPSCPQCKSHRSFERDYGFKFDSEKKLIDWVIVGGESGPGARPMHPDWARSLRDQCQAAGVPFLFKQWGEWISEDQDECPCGPPFKDWMWADGADFKAGDGQRAIPLFRKVGKKTAGRLLDGITHDGYPA